MDEAKEIRDKALAVAAYARQAQDRDMILWATEIKFRAERRTGELLRETAEAGQLHTKGERTPRQKYRQRAALTHAPRVEDHAGAARRLAEAGRYPCARSSRNASRPRLVTPPR